MHTIATDNAQATAAAIAGDAHRDRLAFVTLAAATLAFWMALQVYHGVFHDARLYSLQALNLLHPELFSQDLYLRFGSQDRFTFFSPIYATLIGWLGLEPAAAVLTFVSHAAFYTAAALIARRLLPARLALVSVALLVAVPSEYGPGNMFHAVESFITPRLGAEALVLFAIASLLTNRHWLVVLFMVGALMMHPLMAMAGVAFVLALTAAIPRPRLAVALGAMAVAALAVVAFAVPALRLDDAWRTVILDRMGYVFLSQWSVESWARGLVSLNALGVALLLLPASRPRTVAIAAAVTGLGGLALTVMGADILRMTLVVQSQPWRWLWLTNVIAILLLPAIVGACWQRGHAGRATLAFLVSLWLFRNDAYCLVLMPCVLAAAFYSRRQVPAAGTARTIYFGSLAILVLGVAWSIANNALFAGAVNTPKGATAALQLFRGMAEEGLASVALLLAIWWCATRVANRVARATTAVVAGVLCLGMVPIAAAEWTSIKYTKEVYDAFGAWRRHIPVGTEVVWMDTSIDGWVLLQRPLYLSIDQTGSALFSRAAALEMERRDALLTQYLPEAHFMMPERHKVKPGRTTLAQACSSGELHFIVTRVDLGEPPLERTPEEATGFRGLRLYRCGRGDE